MGLHPFHFRLGADTPNWKFLNISCSCSWVMGTLSLRWLCVVIWNPGGLNVKWFRKKYYCNMRSQIWPQGQKSSGNIWIKCFLHSHGIPRTHWRGYIPRLSKRNWELFLGRGISPLRGQHSDFMPLMKQICSPPGLAGSPLPFFGALHKWQICPSSRQTELLADWFFRWVLGLEASPVA